MPYRSVISASIPGLLIVAAALALTVAGCAAIEQTTGAVGRAVGLDSNEQAIANALASGAAQQITYQRKRQADEAERARAQQIAESQRNRWDDSTNEEFREKNAKQIVKVDEDAQAGTTDVVAVDPATGEANDEVITVATEDLDQAEADNGGYVELGGLRGVYSNA